MDALRNSRGTHSESHFNEEAGRQRRELGQTIWERHVTESKGIERRWLRKAVLPIAVLAMLVGIAHASSSVPVPALPEPSHAFDHVIAGPDESRAAEQVALGSLTLLDQQVIDGFLVQLARGVNRLQEPRVWILVSEPETEYSAWRPLSAVDLAANTDGATYHRVPLPPNSPPTVAYVNEGSFAAIPLLRVKDGAVDALVVNDRHGLVALPEGFVIGEEET